MRNCTKCELEKELTEFYKKKTTKSGYRSECKECSKKHNSTKDVSKIKYQKRKDSPKFKEYRAKWYSENREEINKKNKKYREINSDKLAIDKKRYYQNNKEKILQQRKESYEKNKELIRGNKEKLNLYKKEWRNRNKESLSSKIKDKKKNNPLYKLSDSIRTLIWISTNKIGYTKSSKTSEILGCSFENFKSHIESLFIEDMSWDNHGEWHLDHKTPISWAKTEDEVYKLNHYTNFQPLWSKDNLSKGNKWSD